ncbi:MAG: TolC family protein [Gammaproteobacteria bacterium]
MLVVDGGANDAQIEVATADQKQAVAAYVDAALTAFGEVETALDQSVVLADRKVSLEESITEIENAHRLANLRFNEGETDLLDVLTIQQRMFGSQSNMISLERSQLEQFINLQLALGGD